MLGCCSYVYADEKFTENIRHQSAHTHLSRPLQWWMRCAMLGQAFSRRCLRISQWRQM